MNRTLYDLAGADPALRFSPFCWRTRMALAHKDLPVETIPWRFTEKERIAFSGQGLVPVLVDGERVLHDSWAIAEYLEETYPHCPSLFGGPEAQAVTRFVNAWTDAVLHPWVGRLVVRDILDVIRPEDRGYFRESREKRFGVTLEAFVAERETVLPEFRRALQPVRLVLRAQPFLAGEAPAYADYIVFGAFMWARGASAFRLLESDDPVHAWRERMLDLFDGLARRSPGHEV
ncbi:glutathione S-transferase family protein [Paracraurococcus lichenis]|uniref:Glutathione S-transferase family protein n=1 Tax=Paracraurococcus lichenis TaxID=3064888 RepID=A0ABT9E9V2_9PROT|nr:glutathione S-transferase family protein [Paracraurococcus sp. LOR1-02]MDO9712974.1 glutathione S-transferase family protein [Paracraurococcus sp. LOR1-02]